MLARPSMHDANFFLSAFIYLTTAVLMVPVAHRLGLGSVLGYLIGGAVIGPFALGWVGGTQGKEAMHFAEFGVVIMLIMIGLELEQRGSGACAGRFLASAAFR